MRPISIRRAAAVALVAGAGAAGTLVAQARWADATEPGDRSAAALRAQSQALAARGPVSWTDQGRRHATPAEERAAANRASAHVPLPDGGNFNGIRFEEAEGTLSDADIQFVLEHNAACQWLRAARDGRRTDVAGDILRDVPSWPSFRDSEFGALTAKAADELARGGGPTAAAMLGECDATHAREVSYARDRGRQPST